MKYGEFKYLINTIETNYGLDTGLGWTAIHFINADKVSPVDVQNYLVNNRIEFIDETDSDGFVGFKIDKIISDIDLMTGVKEHTQYIPVESINSLSFIPKDHNKYLNINTALKDIFNIDLTVTVEFKKPLFQYTTGRYAIVDMKNWITLTEPALVKIGIYKTAAERDAATDNHESIEVLGRGTYYLRAFAYNIDFKNADATDDATLIIGG